MTVARIGDVAGHPVAQHNSPNRGGAMSGHRGVVLHIAQGSYRGTISWQMNPYQRYADGTLVNTCSTWIVGRELGEIAQMVDSSLIAWCQRSGSRDWLSVELAGFAPAPPTPWQIEACAHLLAWAHRTHGVPLTVAAHPGQRGLGHHSMDREALGEQWGHDACPGTGVVAAKAAIVARARSIVDGDDDMRIEAEKNLLNEGWSILTGNPAGIIPNEVPGAAAVNVGNPLWTLLRGLTTKLDAIAAKVDIDPAELAAIGAAAHAGAQSGVISGADELAAAVLAIRTVLGGLDAAGPG